MLSRHRAILTLSPYAAADSGKSHIKKYKKKEPVQDGLMRLRKRTGRSHPFARDHTGSMVALAGITRWTPATPKLGGSRASSLCGGNRSGAYWYRRYTNAKHDKNRLSFEAMVVFFSCLQLTKRNRLPDTGGTLNVQSMFSTKRGKYMKKVFAGVLCATFVVGVVFAIPTSGKKEEPKAAAISTVSR